MAVIRKVDNLAGKRLQQLTSQLYGKERASKVVVHHQQMDNVAHFQPTQHHSSDVLYLKRDLSRILVLSVLALGGQIGLWLMTSSGLLHF